MPITLTGSDPDIPALPLTYAIVDQPGGRDALGHGRTER